MTEHLHVMEDHTSTTSRRLVACEACGEGRAAIEEDGFRAVVVSTKPFGLLFALFMRGSTGMIHSNPRSLIHANGLAEACTTRGDLWVYSCVFP